MHEPCIPWLLRCKNYLNSIVCDVVSPRQVQLRMGVSHTRMSAVPDSHTLRPFPPLPYGACAVASDSRRQRFHYAQPSFRCCRRRCCQAATRLPTPRPRGPSSSDRRNQPATERESRITKPEKPESRRAGQRRAARTPTGCLRGLASPRSPRALFPNEIPPVSVSARVCSSFFVSAQPSSVLVLVTDSSQSSNETEIVPTAVRGQAS